VIGFFNTYRDGKRVTRNELGDIAEQYKNWVTNRSGKWGTPVMEAPDGRRDEFIDPYFKSAKPDTFVAILRAREPGRILIANGNKKDDKWHLQMAQRWIIQYNFYVNDARWGRMFVRVCPYFPFTARVCLNQHHWLANRMREEKIDFKQSSNAFLKCGNPNYRAANWIVVGETTGRGKDSSLRDGRILAVLRGSNDRRPALPAYKWACWSGNGGRTWTTPQPWTFDDAQPFHSPSACSQLLPHPNGRIYWLGNINDRNPAGNRSRYPFVVGEVDRTSGRLLRRTLRIVDNLQPGEDPLLTLSNFYAREDRRTGGIALHMTRLLALSDGWRGDAFLYRIPV